MDGKVTNATPSPKDDYLDYLTGLRGVQAVFFDSNGSVIGGAASPTWAEKLPPGGQRIFEIRSSVLAASSIASVELSGR